MKTNCQRQSRTVCPPGGASVPASQTSDTPWPPARQEPRPTAWLVGRASPRAKGPMSPWPPARQGPRPTAWSGGASVPASQTSDVPLAPGSSGASPHRSGWSRFELMSLLAAGRDAFHRVPSFGQEKWDGVESVPTRIMEKLRPELPPRALPVSLCPSLPLAGSPGSSLASLFSSLLPATWDLEGRSRGVGASLMGLRELPQGGIWQLALKTINFPVNHRPQTVFGLWNGSVETHTTIPEVQNGLVGFHTTNPESQNASVGFHATIPEVQNGPVGFHATIRENQNGPVEFYTTIPGIQNGLVEFHTTIPEVQNGPVEFHGAVGISRMLAWVSIRPIQKSRMAPWNSTGQSSLLECLGRFPCDHSRNPECLRGNRRKLSWQPGQDHFDLKPLLSGANRAGRGRFSTW